MNTTTAGARMPRLRGVLTALVASAALVLAGCSSGTPTGGTSPGGGTAPAGGGTGTGAAGETTPAEQGPTTVDHFNMGLGQAPNSLDLPRHFDANVMGIMSLFTEPLERLDGDGGLTPNIAESVTQPDDKTIVYKIREGVKFSNGEDLTAEDVVWTIKHVTDAAAGAQTASITSAVESAEVSGPMEVTVKLSRSDPAARASLALVALVQNAAFGEANAAELGQPTAIPVGTGPYVVTSSSTEKVELERNPNYWGENPPPDKITVSFFPADDTAQLAMRSGSLDGMLVDNLVTLPQYEAISDTQVHSAPVLMSNFWALDTSSAPFDDIHVRKAFAHAIDREGMMRAAVGASGGQLLTTLIPRGTLVPVSSEADVDAFIATLDPITFDLDKAKAELEQSQHASGFSLEIPVMAGSWQELTALNLQQNLAPMGVTITTKTVTPQEWVDMVFGHQTGQMFPMSFAAAVPDPGMLRRVTSEEARTQAGGYNFANWAPADLQPLAASLQETTDNAARWEAAKTILTRINEEVPYIPMFQPEYVVVTANGFSFAQDLRAMDVASGTWIQLLRSN